MNKRLVSVVRTNSPLPIRTKDRYLEFHHYSLQSQTLPYQENTVVLFILAQAQNIFALQNINVS